jgi:hypothetical protein
VLREHRNRDWWELLPKAQARQNINCVIITGIIPLGHLGQISSFVLHDGRCLPFGRNRSSSRSE